MTSCRFMYQSLISDPGQLSLSSARPGLVGMPVAKAQGTAVAYTLGSHSGAQDQVFLLEIDSLAQGDQVGQATFRWRRAGSDPWEATGLATAITPLDLADGVQVKWASGPGQDFFLGDAWTILAGRANGSAALLDTDRDTGWEALGAAQESICVDLGTEQRVTAVILADHNLGEGAQVLLQAGPQADWANPAWSQTLTITRPHLVRFLDCSARYWRLSLADPANSAGALAASLLYLGGWFEPSRMFAAGYGRSLVASRSLTATDAGKVAGCTKGLAQAWQVGFSGLGENDLAGFERMYRAVHNQGTGRLTPLFFTPFSDDPGQTLYCLPGDSLQPSHQHQGRYGLSLDLEEVVRTHV